MYIMLNYILYPNCIVLNFFILPATPMPYNC